MTEKATQGQVGGLMLSFSVNSCFMCTITVSLAVLIGIHIYISREKKFRHQNHCQDRKKYHIRKNDDWKLDLPTFYFLPLVK